MPVTDSVAVQVAGIVFLATLVRSAFGFGEALVAVPLLVFVIPVRTAVPLAVLFSVAVAAIILLWDWRSVHFRSARSLLIATLPGIPLGLVLLTALSPAVVKTVLAVVIMAFSSYCLLVRLRPKLHDDRFAWLFGFGAGVLGGAYGMNGPPLVVYGALRGWAPEQFRATLQGYFLPASAIGLAGFWATGLWGPEVTRLFLISLPAAVIAVLIGRAVNRRMSPAIFVRIVHLGLIALGILLLAEGSRGR